MDQSRLKQLLSYDAKTGEFRRIAKVKAECAELCDFVMAWAVEQGVTLRDAPQWEAHA